MSFQVFYMFPSAQHPGETPKGHRHRMKRGTGWPVGSLATPLLFNEAWHAHVHLSHTGPSSLCIALMALDEPLIFWRPHVARRNGGAWVLFKVVRKPCRAESLCDAFVLWCSREWQVPSGCTNRGHLHPSTPELAVATGPFIAGRLLMIYLIITLNMFIHLTQLTKLIILHMDQLSIINWWLFKWIASSMAMFMPSLV